MLKIGDKVLKINNKWLKGQEDPLNPLNLPPYTLRLKYTEGVTPTFSKGTAVQVSSSPNIWDLTYSKGWNLILDDQTELIEVLGANSTGVTNMRSMFDGCFSLTSVALFDTSKVTDMYGFFFECYSLTSVPLFDTRNVTRMEQMFYRCDSLTSVPLFNTSNVTIMNEMFNGCSSLATVPLFNTSNVTKMSEMFRYCTSLTTIPLFNTSSVTQMGLMFAGCSSLTSIPLFNTSLVSSMIGAFNGCTNVQSGALALYNQAITQQFPPTNHYGTFTDCGSNTITGLAELQQIPTSWGGLKEE